MSISHRKLSDYLWHSPDKLSKQLKNNMVDNQTLNILIDLSLKYLKGELINNDYWTKIVNESFLPSSLFEEIFGEVLKLVIGLLQIPQQAMTKNEILRDLLLLGLSNELAEKLLESKANTKAIIPHFPRVRHSSWRIEVTISSSLLSRVVEPWILLELNLDNGEKKILKLSLKDFNSMRYQVARNLYQLQTKYKLSVS